MDFESYCQYYDKIILPVIDLYKSQYSELIINPNAKNLIWENYSDFNKHCKLKYMKNSEHLIDRHKVVACYIYAIEKSKIIIAVESIKNGDDTNLMLNERLAFCFGMTMFRALILDLIDDLDSSEKKDQARKIFDKGFDFPECNHGDFKNNFLSQLYLTYKDSNYNILALSESLHLLEVYNLVKNGISETLFKI